MRRTPENCRRGAALKRVANRLGQTLLQISFARCQGLRRGKRHPKRASAQRPAHKRASKPARLTYGPDQIGDRLTGLAADFICPSYGKVIDVFEALRMSGIVYDQLIAERGTWIHFAISDNPRHQALVFDGVRYSEVA